MENLPQEFFLEGSAVNVQFLGIKTGEIKAGTYLLSIVEIANSVQQIETGALLIVNNYILGLIWGNDSIYLFHSHSKDENGNVSSFGTAVLIKFDTLHSLENYIRSVYYNAYALTLYFQMQFIQVDCTVNARTAIKCSLRKKILLARRHRDLKAKKRKYHDEPEKKRQAVKKDIRIKKNSSNSIKKKNMWKIEYEILHIRKLGIRKILRCSWHMKNVDTWKTQKVK